MSRVPQTLQQPIHATLWLAVARRWTGLVMLALAAALDACAHGALGLKIERQEALVARQPVDAALRFELAGLYVQHEEWRPALAQLERIDQLAPGKHGTDLLRGEALLGDGQAVAAVKVLDGVIARQPASFRALTFRARALRAMGERTASLADYRAALKATGQPGPELVGEAADALVADGQTDEALAVLAAGIEALGTIHSLVLRALDLETTTGRFDLALAHIDVLQKNSPRPELWMAQRAELLARAGRNDAAREAWSALGRHLAALPNLERGQPLLRTLAEQARRALVTLSANPPDSGQLSSL